MNIFDIFFLKIFLSPKALYGKLNVNTDHLESILKAKLTMDNRRPSVFDQMKSKDEQQEISQSTLKTMFNSLVMGLVLLLSFTIGFDLKTRLTFFFTMFIFLLAAIMISDFTSVLIDIKDNLIILPKPVNNSTFVTSRLLHIAIHLNKILLPMLLPAVILLLVTGKILAVIPFILMSLMAALFVIFLINAFYILVLKITTAEKFQSVISYVQIGIAILIYSSYQLVPRIIGMSAASDLQVSQLSFIYFYPPFWFAEVTESLRTFSFGDMQLLSLVLSVTFPFLCIVVMVKYLAPAFTRKLSMINNSGGETKNTDNIKSRSQAGRNTWIEFMALKMTNGKSEFAAFLFTLKMMSRDREFKIKVYPQLGYTIVLIVLFSFTLIKFQWSELTDLSEKGKLAFFMTIYSPCLVTFSAISQVSFSNSYKASWIFLITPDSIPGHIIAGGLKSVMTYFLLPAYLLFTLVAIPVIGIRIIPDLLLACINCILLSSVFAALTIRNIPFSLPYKGSGTGSEFIRVMLTLFFPLIIGWIHFMFIDSYQAVIISIVVGVLLLWVIFLHIRKNSWRRF